ncbi:MAG: hypothetical protein K1W37_03730, partial [Lachnospiraceae bacterium]
RRGFLTCVIGEIDKSRCVSYFSTVPYDMEDDSAPTIYSFTDIVKVHIYDDLSIHFFRAGFWYLS